MLVTLWRGGLAGCVLALFSGFGAEAQSTMPRIQLPSLGPSVQVRTLEVRDITLGTADAGKVAIGRITFRGFARGPETVRAESVEFDTVVATFGSRTLEVPAIMISGFEVPAALFQALSEGGGGDLDWAALLLKSSAGELTIDRALDTFELSPALKVTYSGLSLKNFRNGLLESAKLDRTSGQSGEDQPDEKLSFNIGEISYQGVDVAELVRFVTGGGGGVAKPLIERSVVGEIGIQAGDVQIAIKKIELVGLDGRAPAASLARQQVPAGPAQIVLPGVTTEPGADRRAAAYGREVLRHLRLSSYSLEGVEVVSAEHGTVSVGAFSLGGLSGRYLDQIEVRNVALSSPKASAKLERFAIERTYYGPLLDTVLDAAVAGRVSEISPDKLGAATPRTGLVRLTGLALDTPIGPMALGDMRIGVDNPDLAVPGTVSFAFDRVRMDLSRLEPNQGGDKLKAYGYDELAADLLLQVRLAANEKALVVENSALMIDRVGRLDFGIRLGNLDVNAAANDAEIAEREIQKAHLEQVSLRLTNLGFAERFFAEVARNQRSSAESPRMQLAAEMRRQAVQRFGALLAPGAAEAIEAFVRSPGRITARAELRPGQPPLVVSQITGLGPQQLAERVVIKVEIPKD